jgi:hypothetical protein
VVLSSWSNTRRINMFHCIWRGAGVVEDVSWWGYYFESDPSFWLISYFKYKVLLQWVYLVFCCRSSRTLYSTRWCQVLHLLQCLLTHQHCQWTHQGQNLWLRLSGMNQWYWHSPLQKDIHMFIENRMLSWSIVDISVQHCGVMINFVKIFVNNSRKW